MSRSVLASSAGLRSRSAVGSTSSSSASEARRATPSAYTVGTHPFKLAANDWLADVAQASLLPRSDVAGAAADAEVPCWSMVLETSSLTTVKALAARRVSTPATTVVPNPSQEECAAMIGAEPDLHAFPSTSHALIEALAGDGGDGGTSSSVRETLLEHGWPGHFRFVWLDYCGTLRSRAGRHRQMDILRLFAQDGNGDSAAVDGTLDAVSTLDSGDHHVNGGGGLLRAESLLAVTLSDRGSAPLYEGELVDSLFLFVRTVAARAGLDVACVGVVRYSVSSPVNTALFEIRRGGVNVNECGGAGGGGGDDGGGSGGPVPRSLDGLTFYPGWRSSVDAATCDDLATPLWSAVRHVAASFAGLVQTHTATEGTAALVVDSKLLPVTRALAEAVLACGCSEGGGERKKNIQKDVQKYAEARAGVRIALRVVPIVPDPLDAVVSDAVHRDLLGLGVPARLLPGVEAEPVGRTPLHLLLSTFEANQSAEADREGGSREAGGEEEAEEGASAGVLACAPFQAVWLGYDRGRPLSARKLSRCSAYADLNLLFRVPFFLDARGAVVAVSVNHASTGECWEWAAVDWVVIGVRGAAAEHGLCADVLRVTSFDVTHPRLTVVFLVQRRQGGEDNGGGDGGGWVTTWAKAGNTAGDMEPEETKEETKRRSKIGSKVVDTSLEELVRRSVLSGDVPAPSPVARWLSTNTWDMGRPKRPTKDAIKYGTVAPWIAALVQCAHTQRVVLHEPGYHHVLPALVDKVGGVVGGVECRTEGDGAQGADLARRRGVAGGQNTAHVGEGGARWDGVTVCEDESAFPADADAVVLLCEGGIGQLRQSWWGCLLEWVTARCRAAAESEVPLLGGGGERGAARGGKLREKDGEEGEPKGRCTVQPPCLGGREEGVSVLSFMIEAKSDTAVEDAVAELGSCIRGEAISTSVQIAARGEGPAGASTCNDPPVVVLDMIIPVFSAGRRNALAVCLVGRDPETLARGLERWRSDPGRPDEKEGRGVKKEKRNRKKQKADEVRELKS